MNDFSSVNEERKFKAAGKLGSVNMTRFTFADIQAMVLHYHATDLDELIVLEGAKSQQAGLACDSTQAMGIVLCDLQRRLRKSLLE